MGTITLYAIKSAICLAVLYLPYALWLKRETFFAFNRFGLLLIILLSLLVPCIDLPLWSTTLQGLLEEEHLAVVEVGMPVLVSAEEGQTGQQLPSGPHVPMWAYLLVYTYMAGMLVCMMLKARQLYRLLRFIPSGCLWTDRKDGVNIYCHAGEQGAFSWMHSIVVGESDSSPDSPVMAHEMAHVLHGHSYDALFVSIVEILQWFNPCIWMLDISLREIHEYEADDAVLRRGITARDYQLLLIENAVRGSHYAFANGFNHSLLKKRIHMMMKKKSSKWARMRMLYVVPATLVVIGAFASQHFASQSTPVSQLPPPSISHDASPVQKVEKTIEITEPLTQQNESEEKPLQPTALPSDTLKSAMLNGKQVYEVAEVMPEYPGGISELMKYLYMNVRYPAIAHENNVQGRYTVSFIVTDEGKVEDVKIVDGPKGEKPDEIVVVGYASEADSLEITSRIKEAKGREALEAEAMRVVCSMPAWKPGLVNGEPVNCHFALPISFRLQ